MHGKDRPRPLGVGDFVVEAKAEERAIGKAGKRVVVGQEPDPRFRFPALTEIADGEN